MNILQTQAKQILKDFITYMYIEKKNQFQKRYNKFENIMNKLCELRKDKIMPGIDTKILLSWNCLYIKGLIKLYKVSNNKNVLKVIDKSFEFIFKFYGH